MQYSPEFLFDIPKSDLHLHLDGSIRINSLIEMAKTSQTDLPSYEEAGLKEQVFKDHYSNLGEYLQGFRYTCDVLRNMENLERAAYELAMDNIAENVFYIEVRFSPQLLMDTSKGVTIDKVLVAANKGLERAQKEYNQTRGERPEFHYGLILCAMRTFGPEGFSPYYTNLFNVMKYFKAKDVVKLAAMELARASVRLRDELSLPIVGIDLAGQEEGHPAHHFSDVYQYAHKHFMHKTVHAGEAYGAESIFQAITECYADRIGHGYSLFIPELIKDPNITDKEAYINHLASFIADKRTVIEVCLTSNQQTNPAIQDLKNHKFKDMLSHRMATTICTDNRLVSNTTVTNEFQKAVDTFEIPLKRLKDIVAYGYKKSFYPGNYVEKRNYAKNTMQYFDKVAHKHGLKS
jgi:adenosine deaminase